MFLLSVCSCVLEFRSLIRLFVCFFFFKAKSAYEVRISDWSSDGCFSDLLHLFHLQRQYRPRRRSLISTDRRREWRWCKSGGPFRFPHSYPASLPVHTHRQAAASRRGRQCRPARGRSEEHTSELQSLMRISYAVFCLNKKNTQNQQ